jgi:hypothetical protein
MVGTSPALASRKESVVHLPLIETAAYSDLGDAWLRERIARLTQKHLQFGGHYRIDADALLSGWARTARAAKAAAGSAGTKLPTEGGARRAMKEAIEHCSHPEDRFPHAAAVAIAR